MLRYQLTVMVYPEFMGCHSHRHYLTNEMLWNWVAVSLKADHWFRIYPKQTQQSVGFRRFHQWLQCLPFFRQKLVRSVSMCLAFLIIPLWQPLCQLCRQVRIILECPSCQEVPLYELDTILYRSFLVGSSSITHIRIKANLRSELPESAIPYRISVFIPFRYDTYYSLHVVKDQNPWYPTQVLKASQYAPDEGLITHVVMKLWIYPPGVFHSANEAVSGSPGNLSKWKLTSLSPVYLKILSWQTLKSPDGFLLRHLLLLADPLHPLVEDAVATLVWVLWIFPYSLQHHCYWNAFLHPLEDLILVWIYQWSPLGALELLIRWFRQNSFDSFPVSAQCPGNLGIGVPSFLQ